MGLLLITNPKIRRRTLVSKRTFYNPLTLVSSSKMGYVWFRRQRKWVGVRSCVLLLAIGSIIVKNFKFSRAVIVDPSVIGESHILVNSGFIKIVADVAEELVIITENKHAEALKTYINMDDDRARMKFFGYDSRNEMRHSIHRVIDEANTDILLFLNLEFKNNNISVFASSITR